MEQEESIQEETPTKKVYPSKMKKTDTVKPKSIDNAKKAREAKLEKLKQKRAEETKALAQQLKKELQPKEDSDDDSNDDSDSDEEEVIIYKPSVRKATKSKSNEDVLLSELDDLRRQLDNLKSKPIPVPQPTNQTPTKTDDISDLMKRRILNF